MKLVLIYILTFVALIYLFFVDHGAKPAYVPLKEGLLYSTSISSQTTLNDEVTEKILFKRTAEDEYPTIEVFSAENLPGKFLARLTEAKDAKYRLIASGADACRTETDIKGRAAAKNDPGGLKKARERSIAARAAAIAAVTVQKEVPQEILNVNKVRDIVNTSEKTYFFAIGAEKTLNEATLKIKSITPWQDKSIITAEFTNGAAKYFFIANISVTAGGMPLQAQLFNEPFVQGNKTANIFILTRQLKSETVSVKLSESSGDGRKFDIPITMP